MRTADASFPGARPVADRSHAMRRAQEKRWEVENAVSSGLGVTPRIGNVEEKDTTTAGISIDSPGTQPEAAFR